MKRGQVSVEFIAIFGFIFLMMIPLVLIFFDQSNNVKDAIASNHLRNIAIKIADKAETVYFLGEPSKTTIKAYFPEHIEYINISSRTLIFGLRTSRNNIQQIISVSSVNMTGNISIKPGIHYIEVTSSGDYALVRDR